MAVNPKDERYTKYIGEAVQLPLAGRAIPVIADDYVDPAFGTGCVKITPAHDFNDWAVGQRHKLTPVEMLTLDAKVKGTQYSGLDRFEARTRILADLKAQGLLVSEKPYKLRVPRSGRTGVIVEPMLTDQWFVKMETLARAGLEAVADDGQIEAFSVPQARGFALAVQWHPEYKALENPVSMKLLDAFAAACRERAVARLAAPFRAAAE